MFWKNKKEKENSEYNNELYRKITVDVVSEMLSMHVISTPALKTLLDDKGILEHLIHVHTTDKDVLALKEEDIFTYLFVCGMHAFGAGVYVTLFQGRAGKPVNEFDAEDLKMIALSFSNTDIYDLALSSMGLDSNSNNKKVFDQIIITAVRTAMIMELNESTKPDNVRQLMKVLYNAGTTVVMRKAGMKV